MIYTVLMAQVPSHPYLKFLQQDPELMKVINLWLKEHHPGWRIYFNKKYKRYEVRHRRGKFAFKQSAHFQEAFTWLFFADVFRIDIRNGNAEPIKFDFDYIDTEEDVDIIHVPAEEDETNETKPTRRQQQLRELAARYDGGKPEDYT